MTLKWCQRHAGYRRVAYSLNTLHPVSASVLQMVHDKRAPLTLLAQPAGGLPRNTVPAGAPWPALSPFGPASLSLLGGGACTPAPIRGLTLSLQGTPCSIPMLPLLSPGITPSLGIGLGPLTMAASSTTGVVPVATDPLRWVMQPFGSDGGVALP